MALRTVHAALYFTLFATPLLIVSPDAMFGYSEVPKVAAVRVMAGIVAAAWIVHIATGAVMNGRRPVLHPVFVRQRHAKWISGSAGALLVIGIVSAGLSVSQTTALSGTYPGFDSTDFYTFACYLLLGAAAARFLRTRRHIETAAWSLAAAGGIASIYGLVQYAGFDPLHLDRFETDSTRAPLTFGSSGFAGSYLTLSLMVSIGVFLMQKSPFSRRELLLFVLILLQVVGLGVTASRGAWIGTGAGVAVFLALSLMAVRSGHTTHFWVLAWKSRGRRRRKHLLTIAATVAVVVGGAVALTVTGNGASTAAEGLQTLNSDVIRPGLDGKQAIWSATFEMLGERPWIESEQSNVAVLHLFGYGPDTYRYAYQLVAPPEHVASSVPHAHNSFLNTAAELGIAGLLAWTVLTVSVLYAGASLARDRTASPWVRLTVIAITSALAAHAVDQLVNVPRAADSVTMWILIGTLVSLLAVRRPGAERLVAVAGSVKPERQAVLSRPLLIALAAPPIAALLMAIIIGTTVLSNSEHLIADVEAGRLQSSLLSGDDPGGLASRAHAASSVAEDVSFYHSLEAWSLETAANAASDSASRDRLLQRALDARADAAKLVPLSPAENLAYARVLSQTGRQYPALDRYRRAVELSPNHWAIWLELAEGYAAVGDRERGLEALDAAERLITKQPEEIRSSTQVLLRFSEARLALELRQD